MAVPLTLRMLWAIRDDRSLSKAPRELLRELLGFIDADGVCFPSVRKLAQALRTSPGAVRRYLRQLEVDAGPLILTIERGRRSVHGDADVNHYRLSLRAEQTSKGWDQGCPTRDQSDPRVGSPVPKGWDQAAPTGGITGAPEEGHKKKTKKEGGGKREQSSRRPPPDFVFNDEDRKVEDEAKTAGVDVELARARWFDHTHKRLPSEDELHGHWRNWLREDTARGGPLGSRQPPKTGAALELAEHQQQRPGAERPRNIHRVDRQLTAEDRAAVPTASLAELLRVANGTSA